MKRRQSPRIVISSSQKALRVPRKELIDLIRFVGAQEGTRISHVDLAVVDRREITSVNRRWLSHGGATDVISFDMTDEYYGRAGYPSGLSTQLVVCGDVAVEQARARGTTAKRELMTYVIHGLLHMMGYEDQSIRGAARMHAREDEILAAFARRTRRKG